LDYLYTALCIQESLFVPITSAVVGVSVIPWRFDGSCRLRKLAEEC